MEKTGAADTGLFKRSGLTSRQGMCGIWRKSVKLTVKQNKGFQTITGETAKGS